MSYNEILIFFNYHETLHSNSPNISKISAHFRGGGTGDARGARAPPIF